MTDTTRRTDIDVLLLDFGGPCLLSPFELHATTEEQLGLEPGTITWRGPFDLASDDLYRTMVAGGTLTEREYWARRTDEVAELSGRPDLDLHTWFGGLYNPPRAELVRPQCIDVTDRARDAGYGVSILTNDLSAFHGPDWAAGIPFLDTVDHLIDLSHSGHLKPDPQAYALAIETTGVAADRLLFVDDQPGNIRGAEAAGIECVYFDIADPIGSWTTVARRLGLDD